MFFDCTKKLKLSFFASCRMCLFCWQMKDSRLTGLAQSKAVANGTHSSSAVSDESPFGPLLAITQPTLAAFSILGAALTLNALNQKGREALDLSGEVWELEIGHTLMVWGILVGLTFCGKRREMNLLFGQILEKGKFALPKWPQLRSLGLKSEPIMPHLECGRKWKLGRQIRPILAISMGISSSRRRA